MIVIIDHGVGNFGSVSNALTSLDIANTVTCDPEQIRRADKLILPGTGAFAAGMQNLADAGLVDLLTEEVMENGKPLLGICLGMQMLCTKSYEGSEHAGLGWIDATVYPLAVDAQGLRVPHVGWNDVACDERCPLFTDGRTTQTFYFAHSFYLKAHDPSLTAGQCTYGVEFCAAIHKDNIFAVQFHPEKSQFEGLEVLRKFAALENHLHVKKAFDPLPLSEERPSCP